MDIDRIQKINQLAVDLVQQGLAIDREDAIAQAEKIFKVNDIDSDLNQMSTNSLQVDQTSNEVDASVEDVTTSTSVDNPGPIEPSNTISSDDLNKILETNTSFLVEKIKGFSDSLSLMEKKFNVLNQEVRDLKIDQRRIQQEQASSKTLTSPSPPSPSSEVQSSSNTTASHPRSGNYGDEDVSIEKFFYAGNK